MPISSRSALVVIGCLFAVGGCAASESSDNSIGINGPDSTTSTTQLARRVGAVETTTPPTSTPAVIRAGNGRAVPRAPAGAAEAAELFVEVERALRDESRAADHPDLGHQEQVLIRSIARNAEWHESFLAALPDDLAPIAELHLRARAALGRLHTAPALEHIPSWEIIEPEPLDDLLAHYREAEAATGIEWRVLAGINLVETGMGRIDGLSSAGAQGPMQFLPTTWEEVAEGGDIDDPHDAIQGAARYLVRRGGLDDIRAGLWGYNNSDDYVDAVLTYAELFEIDETAVRGVYNWEIYVGTEAGTLWLPVGFRAEEPIRAQDYLAENPWAETLP